MILNLLEKKYFKKKKFIQEFEKETENCRHHYKEEYGLEDIEYFEYYKAKSKLKLLLRIFYAIFGVYENIFINIDYRSSYFYLPRQTKNYITFYFLFYIQNIIFAIILYFGFNYDIRIILFYVFTFPISVLIQILYRRVKIEEKVSY